MARFDVYENPAGGYLVSLQSDLLDGMTTTVVAPLVPTDRSPGKLSRLHPILEMGGTNYVMATHLMASVPNTILKSNVENLDRHHDEILAALDMLFLGY
jgi:toxin CcdB